jgi:hypothetical protein
MGPSTSTGKTQKSENFPKNVEKRLFPNFTSILSWKSRKPRNAPRGISGKKSAQVCTGFGVIFDTFSMLRQIATALFSIKTQNFRCFRDVLHFAFFCIFLHFFANLWHFGKKCPKMSRFRNSWRLPAAQAYVKHVFPGRISRISKLHKSVLGFQIPDFEFPEFVPWRSKKHCFLYIYKRLQPETMKNTRCYLRDFVVFSRISGFGKHISHFDISGISGNRAKVYVLYTL